MTNKIGARVAWPQDHRLQEGTTLNIKEIYIYIYLFPPPTLWQKDKLIVIIQGASALILFCVVQAITLQNVVKLMLRPHYLHKK
jgi:hypothetical protein